MSPEGLEPYRDRIIVGLIFSPAPLLRPGALEGDLGKGVGGDEGTGLTAPYTYLRVSLDCYPLLGVIMGKIVHMDHAPRVGSCFTVY
jgi:hypothetical protein